MSDLSFAAVSAAMFVVSQAEKPRDIIWTKLPQMEGKSETRFSYQSERSMFRGGLFRWQSKINLSINGMRNLLFRSQNLVLDWLEGMLPIMPEGKFVSNDSINITAIYRYWT